MTYHDNFKNMIKQIENKEPMRCRIYHDSVQNDGDSDKCDTCPMNKSCWEVRSDLLFVDILRKHVNRKEVLEELLK